MRKQVRSNISTLMTALIGLQLARIPFLVLLLMVGMTTLAQAETTTYYVTNARGTVVATMDRQGNVTYTAAYRPYGQQVKGAPQGGPGYTGHVNDPATGLVYMQQRYYDPVIGRFISPDPVGPAAGNVFNFGRYTYGNNSPYVYVDPDGRQDCDDACLRMRYASDRSIMDMGMAGSGGGHHAYAMDAMSYGMSAQGREMWAATRRESMEGAKAGAQLIPGVALGECVYGGCSTYQWVMAAIGAIPELGELRLFSKADRFERVVSNAELRATQRTGLLRGGREGENFFTNSASLDAKRAQQRLGLDGPLRDARIRFRIKDGPSVTGPRIAPGGRTGTSGGGREFSTLGKTKIEILRVDPLRK